MSGLALFFSYIRSRAWALTAAAAGLLIFGAVFLLYSLPAEPFIYACILSAAAAAAVAGAGFSKYAKKHGALLDAESRIKYELAALPAPEGAAEEDYQRIIGALDAIRSELVSSFDSSRKDMTDYYTIWAHQIKTPIAAMHLLLQSGGEGRDAGLSAELFKIEQYVDMVLSYLRLGSETTDFVIKECCVDDVIRRCIRKYAGLFIMKKLKLEFEGTGLKAVTDEKWLEFVIGQILSNALKYTNSGAISIFAEGRTLAVRDTGIGISPEDLPRVCEKGYTGYNGRADTKSTGLGLYLCSSILKKLGHTLSIDSEAGKGTCVRIGLEARELQVE